MWGGSRSWTGEGPRRNGVRPARRAAAAIGVALAIGMSFAWRAGAFVVCVDPGHGGNDPGAVGTCAEKEINLAVANALIYFLTHDPDFQGSFATRTTDVAVSLSQRVTLAAQSGADAFVSLHHNAGAVAGTFVEYDTTSQQQVHWPFSMLLAGAGADGLCGEFSWRHGLACLGACVDQAPACSGAALYVLRENARPAALGEPCGVATSVAARLCSTAVYAETTEEARGYRRGLREFFGLTPIGTSLTASGGPAADTLRWIESDPQRLVVYALSRSDACWGPFAPLATVAAHDPAHTSDDTHYTYVDGAVEYSRPYWYRIEVAGERVTAWAAPTALPPASPPDAPENLVGAGWDRGGGRARVLLAWDAPGGEVSGYHVYRSQYDPMPDCGAVFDVVGGAASPAFEDTTAPLDVPLFYRVRATNATGGSDVTEETALVVARAAAVEAQPAAAAGIGPVTPNPSSRGAAIPYVLPGRGRAVLSIHDVAGRTIAIISDDERDPGPHVAFWNGRDGRGRAAASGAYFARLAWNGSRIGTRRLVLLR